MVLALMVRAGRGTTRCSANLGRRVERFEFGSRRKLLVLRGGALGMTMFDACWTLRLGAALGDALRHRCYASRLANQDEKEVGGAASSKIHYPHCLLGDLGFENLAWTLKHPIMLRNIGHHLSGNAAEFASEGASKISLTSTTLYQPSTINHQPTTRTLLHTCLLPTFGPLAQITPVDLVSTPILVP